MNNPISGLLPDFAVFGAEFDALWKKIFAGIWALALLWTIVQLVIALASMAQSKGQQHAAQLSEARRDAIWAASALGAVAALGLIVTVILSLVA